MLTVNMQRQKDGSVIATNKRGEILGNWGKWFTSRPDKRYRYIMLNCWRYRIEWMPDAT